MRHLLALLAVLLVAGGALGAQISGTELPFERAPAEGWELTEDNEAGVYALRHTWTSARVDFQLGSAFAGTLYVCNTSDADADGDDSVDAAAGCQTVLSLSADAESTVSTGKTWYVLDIDFAETSGNTSRLTIRGTNDQAYLSEPVNAPFDSDGDGSVDSIVVRGSSPKVIDDANDKLFAAAGTDPKTIHVIGGPYSMDGVTFDWNGTRRGFIELADNTTLACRPGTEIRGYDSASDYSALGSTRIVTNETDGAEITIDGCILRNPAFEAPYDASGFTSQIHYVVHADDVKKMTVRNSRISGSNHTCLYVRDYLGVDLVNNRVENCGGVFEHGGDASTLNGAVTAGSFTIDLQTGDCTSWTCAAGDIVLWQLDNGEWHMADVISVSTDELTIRPAPTTDAASGNTVFRMESATVQNAIYLFAQDFDGEDARVVGNIVDLVAGVGIHPRANDNTVTHRDLVVQGNAVSRTGGVGIDPRSMIGGTIQGNSFEQTEGLLLVDDGAGDIDYCYSDNADADCTDGVEIVGNVFRENRWQDPSSVSGAFFWGRGHSNVTVKGNLVDGTIEGSCMTILGDSPGSSMEETTLKNCARNGLEDGQSAGTAIAAPFTIKNLTIQNTGVIDITNTAEFGVLLTKSHSGLVMDGVNISGCTGDCFRYNLGSSETVSGFALKNFSVDATRSGFLGRFKEAPVSGLGFDDLTCDADLEQRWILVTNASSSTDCDPSSGTGVIQNACECAGGSFTDMGDPVITPVAKGIQYVIGTSSTMSDVSAINGTIKNIGQGQEGFRVQGASGTLTRGVFRDIFFSNDGQGRRDADSMVNALRIDAGTVTAANVAGISCGANVTNCITTDLDDTEVDGQSFLITTQTPNGACSEGALMIDSDGGAGATLYVCEGGTWAAL